jgi:hypothetical protein
MPTGWSSPPSKGVESSTSIERAPSYLSDDALQLLGTLCFVLHFLEMPRYYFNVYYVTPSIDDEGEELRDGEAAWHQATVTAGELFKDIDGKFRPDQEWSLEVTDERRKPIYVINISARKK